MAKLKANGIIDVGESTTNAVGLMREYTKKLNAIAESSRAWINYIADEGSFPESHHSLPTEMVTTLDYLKPAISDLARHVSGIIEHGRVEGLEKIQLRIRLAELESALLRANNLSRDALSEYHLYSSTNKAKRKK